MEKWKSILKMIQSQWGVGKQSAMVGERNKNKQGKKSPK
jgi:hypothetical protein